MPDLHSWPYAVPAFDVRSRAAHGARLAGISSATTTPCALRRAPMPLRAALLPLPPAPAQAGAANGVKRKAEEEARAALNEAQMAGTGDVGEWLGMDSTLAGMKQKQEQPAC